MISPLPEILEDLRQGRMIILTDDEERENEGDLILPAEKVTPEAVNFMTKYGRGLVCLVLTPERLRALDLPPMTTENTSHFGTAFHVSIGAATGISTGISAHDRAKTIQVAIDPGAKPVDLSRPGHVFPLSAREGGVLVRAGHTEGSVDLMKLAGLQPAAVICEVMSDDGSMARMPELEVLAAEHGIKITTIQEIIRYRRRTEQLVKRAVETTLPTEYGDFQLVAYEGPLENSTHLALVRGEVAGRDDVLVRIHSECLTGDVFHSMRCDCGAQLQRALKMIAEEGCGALIYLRQEGRGIGLVNKIRAYKLQDQGMDTVEANVHLGFAPDPREYGVAAQILTDLGITRLRLLTNNPVKRAGLESYGLHVSDRVPLQVPSNALNQHYLETKKEKLGHLIG